uniref:NADH-ubiquinone oxidoreductase chain 4 n=1 Tax=Eviota ocellifer TaxID=2301492 RepID=A0A5K7TNE4_9GOBI|nr:NADH dehydrogenase subunit 4 [Eviota ocellifer]
MLTLSFALMMVLPTIWLSKDKWLWTSTFVSSIFPAALSVKLLNYFDVSSWSDLSFVMALDALSIPLLVLSMWLLPLMILANQKLHVQDSMLRQRMFLTTLTVLQLVLLLAFASMDLLFFYLAFEATLIPTLIIITRWGAQIKRLKAGSYMIYYTLLGSLPTLISFLVTQIAFNTLCLMTINYATTFPEEYAADKFWWVGCLLAFLVKSPMYGVHLWLPKAHVEAPIAGSMILAAILLKLGGYGMIRVITLLDPLTTYLAIPLIVLALWGVVMTSATCLRQTDLKSLIAYSSIGHMGLVIAAILTQTTWGHTGALILMISHGLTSSALFCLANTNYERTQSRTLLLARGLRTILPLMTFWWLIAILANLALPPLPNLMAELIIVTSLIHWSTFTLILTGAGMFLTAFYSLYLYLTTQKGALPSFLHPSVFPTFTREQVIMFLHILPLILLIAYPLLTSQSS